MEAWSMVLILLPQEKSWSENEAELVDIISVSLSSHSKTLQLGVLVDTFSFSIPPPSTLEQVELDFCHLQLRDFWLYILIMCSS